MHIELPLLHFTIHRVVNAWKKKRKAGAGGDEDGS